MDRPVGIPAYAESVTWGRSGVHWHADSMLYTNPSMESGGVIELYRSLGAPSPQEPSIVGQSYSGSQPALWSFSGNQGWSYVCGPDHVVTFFLLTVCALTLAVDWANMLLRRLGRAF